VPEELSNVLRTKGIDRRTVVLLLLHFSSGHAMPKELCDLASKSGMPKVKKWKVSQLLNDLGDLVARFEDGWEVTSQGHSRLSELGLLESSPTKSPQFKLREILGKVSDTKVRGFVEEAVAALEYKLPRASVVLSWIGAVSILHREVMANHLSDFNSELAKRKIKPSEIKSEADLSLLKEYDLLQICRAIGVFDKNTKDELEGCLKLRNSCGHPSGLKFGEHKVASHIETLLLNIYEPFSGT
jgi:hypothetical protein